MDKKFYVSPESEEFLIEIGALLSGSPVTPSTDIDDGDPVPVIPSSGGDDDGF